MFVGKISEVTGTRIKAEVQNNMPPWFVIDKNIIPAPHINSYVKTKVGLETVLLQVTGERKALDKDGASSESNILELEVRGYLDNGKFLSGIRMLPIVGAEIETVDQTDLNILYDTDENSIDVGANIFDSANRVSLKINSLIPQHIGIFGNTGSGKSNTVAKLLKEYINKIPNESQNAKIIIFDLNNEYGSNSVIRDGVGKRVYKLSTHKQFDEISEEEKIPFDFNELSADNLCTIFNVTEITQQPVVRSTWRKIKDPEYINNFETNIRNAIYRIIRNAKVQIFRTLNYYAHEYIKGLDAISYNAWNNSGFYIDPPAKTRQYMNNFERAKEELEQIICIKPPKTWIKKFYLELIIQIANSSESGTNFEHIQPLIPRGNQIVQDLTKIFRDPTSKDKKIPDLKEKLIVIQLGNTNTKIRELIPSLFSEMLFQSAVSVKKDEKVKKITTIVVDEGHNLLAKPTDDAFNRSHKNTLRVFERIIKEGRKFGMYLLISSQRPSDISETITSQLHNYFIHRLVNPNDIEKIRRTVSFMGDNSLKMMSNLGQGECIISGPALDVPQFVQVDELDAESKPNSDDVVLFGENGIFGNS
jgi:ABC-type dipeptide/oligopeptide/nickel transport system ATPase component